MTALDAKFLMDLFAGWNNFFEGVLDNYYAVLMERRFGDIEVMAGNRASWKHNLGQGAL